MRRVSLSSTTGGKTAIEEKTGITRFRERIRGREDWGKPMGNGKYLGDTPPFRPSMHFEHLKRKKTIRKKIRPKPRDGNRN